MSLLLGFVFSCHAEAIGRKQNFDFDWKFILDDNSAYSGSAVD